MDVWHVKRTAMTSGFAHDGRTRPLEAAVASRPKKLNLGNHWPEDKNKTTFYLNYMAFIGA